ncbi:MAG: N-acetylmuramoyl-L-alanine amidase [Vicinamibacteria bacterium]|nr:N-acetylmuramoyl-L-alanine amidase [Vicinamibacteria bacterium]
MTRPHLRLPLTSLATAVLWASPMLTPISATTVVRAQNSSAAATPRATPRAKSSSKSGSAQTRRAKPRATPAPPPAKPDRSLYQQAERLARNLSASSRLRARQSEWDKVVGAYRVVVHKYPRSPYCDDALLKAGDLQRQMATRFKSQRYLDQALDSYSLIVSEYPGSSLGESALYATYEILTERKRTTEAREAAEKYLAAYPDGTHAAILGRKTTASKAAPGARGSSAAAASAKSGGAVQVFGVRFWSGETSTRVVIDLDRKVEIKQDRLMSPARLFVDLMGTRLHPNLVGKTFPVGNAFLQQIRIGVNREDVVRVVIDFEEATGHNMFFLEDPARLVIDIKGDAPKGARSGGGAGAKPEASPGDRASPRPQTAEVMENVEVNQPLPVLPAPVADPTPSPTPEAPATRSPPRQLPTPRVEAPPLSNPVHTPNPAPRPGATQAPTQTPTATPDPPAKNRDGTYSLARQLGLGARRICLDAGHGGHDPGAIGRGGTQEKDITLAVVLKLEKLIRTQLGADVVLTRDTDVFIPLEERTAIANASGADMFLSVHINSARNRTGRGLETYYLSFARSAAAEELAARENAISQATMKDLNNLVKAIATNSKIEESRDFAGIIQKNNVGGLSPSFPGVLDRGVHTAPFYVLIGANMPSILTEVGFISHPEEEHWLKSNAYQEKLAESLLEGVQSYLSQLNRSQNTRLDGRVGVRVPAKGRSKH